MVDAYGHVTVRHPDNPGRYLMSCSRAPELVTLDDIMEFTLDGEPVDDSGRVPYAERFIHGAIYEKRPDVNSVVHNHSHAVIPFGVTGVKLRPIVHVGASIGAEVPVWDIRDKFGETNLLVVNMEQGRDLADCLGGNRVALMRGHGCAVAGGSHQQSTMTSVYLQVAGRAAGGSDADGRGHLSLRCRDRALLGHLHQRDIGQPGVAVSPPPRRRDRPLGGGEWRGPAARSPPPSRTRRPAAGSGLVASLPDGWIAALIEEFEADSRFDHVPVNREESAIGLCSGAFFGGRGSLALMGASGLMTCIYAITKINYTYMVPMTIFITMRGRLGDRAKFHVSNGLYLEPVMQSIDLPYTVIERRDQLGEIRRAEAHSRTISRPVVVGFTRDLLYGESA